MPFVAKLFLGTKLANIESYTYAFKHYSVDMVLNVAGVSLNTSTCHGKYLSESFLALVRVDFSFQGRMLGNGDFHVQAGGLFF